MVTEAYPHITTKGAVHTPLHKRVRCYVISDLHFGAPYADPDKANAVLKRGLDYDRELSKVLKEGLEDKRKPAKICVLLGDIYEYTNHPLNLDETAMEKVVDAHMAHLRDIIHRYPETKFVYVLGNHERMPIFDRKIDALAYELGPDRLELRRRFIKIGDGLFIHGDQAMAPEKFYTQENELSPIPESHKIGDPRYEGPDGEVHRNAAVKFLHGEGNRVLPYFITKVGNTKLVNRAQRCAQKIFDWCHAYDIKQAVEYDAYPYPNRSADIQSILPLPEKSILDGIHHLFMGHTHTPFTGKEFTDPATDKSYVLHNTGASLGYLGIGHDINRQCFNALNVYLDSANLEEATIQEVCSFRSPKNYWPNAQSKLTEHLKTSVAVPAGR